MNNIRHAGDAVLIADRKIKLQKLKLINSLNDPFERRGLKKDTSETEVIDITKRKERLMIDLNIQDKVIKQVKSFKLLVV